MTKASRLTLFFLAGSAIALLTACTSWFEPDYIPVPQPGGFEPVPPTSGSSDAENTEERQPIEETPAAQQPAQPASPAVSNAPQAAPAAPPPQQPAQGTWRDSKTGQAVPSAPAAPGAEVDLTDPNRAFNPANGANYFWDPGKPAAAAPPQTAGGAPLPWQRAPVAHYWEIYAQGGPAFSSTGRFGPTADYDIAPMSRFGTGYDLGFGLDYKWCHGFFFGGEFDYIGDLSPVFIATGKDATSSAHAEAFFIDAKIIPGHVWPMLRPYTRVPGNGYLYWEGGVGFSVNQMDRVMQTVGGANAGTLNGATKTSFAWETGLGIRWPIRSLNSDFSVGYRFTHLGDFTSGNQNTLGATTTTQAPLHNNLDTQNLYARFAYRF